MQESSIFKVNNCSLEIILRLFASQYQKEEKQTYCNAKHLYRYLGKTKKYRIIVALFNYLCRTKRASSECWPVFACI